MSLKKLFLMGSCPLSNNLDLVKPWVQQTDCWGTNNVGMVWDVWKNGHSSPEFILIYVGCSDTFGNTELSFSCRIRKSPGVQGCRDLQVASVFPFFISTDWNNWFFNYRLQQLSFCVLFWFWFSFVLGRNFQVSMNFETSGLTIQTTFQTAFVHWVFRLS